MRKARVDRFAFNLNFYSAIIALMDRETLPKELQFISYCMRLQTDAQAESYIKNLLDQPISWQAIIKQSFYHGLLPILYYNTIKLDKLSMLKANIAPLKSFYEANLARNALLWEEFCYLQKRFKDAGIKLIPLKGIILSETLYHNPGLRVMVDIDILIREEDLHLAEKQVLGLGYQKQLKNLPESYWRRHQCHFQYFSHKKGVIVELHWAIAPARPNRLDLGDVWSRSRVKIINQTEVLTLSPEDTLLSLLLHIGKNISSLRYIKLKNLYDIHELIFQYNATLGWEYILAKIREWRIKGVSYYIYVLTNTYFATAWPKDVVIKLRPGILQRKIMDILSSRLRAISHLQAALFMFIAADTLTDRLALILMSVSIIYQKKRTSFSMRKHDK